MKFSGRLHSMLLKVSSNPFSHSSGLNDAAYIFQFCAFDIELACFTVPTLLFGVNSNMSWQHLPNICCHHEDFAKGRFRGRIHPEWVLFFSNNSRQWIPVYMCQFHISIERKHYTIVTLIHFRGFHQLWNSIKLDSYHHSSILCKFKLHECRRSEICLSKF